MSKIIGLRSCIVDYSCIKGPVIENSVKVAVNSEIFF